MAVNGLQLCFSDPSKLCRADLATFASTSFGLTEKSFPLPLEQPFELPSQFLWWYFRSLLMLPQVQVATELPNKKPPWLSIRFGCNVGLYSKCRFDTGSDIKLFNFGIISLAPFPTVAIRLSDSGTRVLNHEPKSSVYFLLDTRYFDDS